MFLQERIMEINRSLKNLEKASHIAVWGAGVHTSKLLEKTELSSYPIEFVLDMDERKHGERFFKWIIKKPQEITWIEIDAVLISVPNREQEIIYELRNKFGYAGTIVTLYTEKSSTPFYRLYDERIPAIRYLGDYRSWKEAAADCAGYSDDKILNRVISSIEKVRKGEAAWERDSYLFYEEQYVYRICAAILRCAVQNKGKGVRVLDIGGSLGSSWFQNRKYLKEVENLEYLIAEQDHFAKYGQENLADGTLQFIRSIDKWEDMEQFDIILMSASLQYIAEWKDVISRIKIAGPRYVILDRLMVSDRTRICVETVPEEIYSGSYPLIIFDKSEVPNFFGDDYRVIEDDSSSVYEEAYFTDGKAESRFYVFACGDKQ